MNRHFNWMEKLSTRGGLLKLSVIGTAISAVGCIMLMEPAWWKATKNFVKRLFNR